jgi:hypothetical protein
LKIRTTSAQAIPEPTSLTSFAILGLGGLLLRLKKIAQKNEANREQASLIYSVLVLLYPKGVVDKVRELHHLLVCPNK